MYIHLNDKHNRLLDSILCELIELQLEDGSFKYSTFELNSGPYQTLEALVPFLVTPLGNKYYSTIKKGLEYILRNQEPDGGFKPFPEYRYWDHSAVDSSALALYVLCLSRGYPCIIVNDEYDLSKTRLIPKIEKAILRVLKYISSQINEDGGWGLIKLPSFFSRTYSTSIVINGLSYCKPKDFELADVDGLHLIKSGVDFLLELQDTNSRSDNYGAWGYSSECDSRGANITAVTIWSLVATLRYNRDIDVVKAIDLGVKYVSRCEQVNDEIEELKVPISSSRKKDSYRNEKFIHDHR